MKPKLILLLGGFLLAGGVQAEANTSSLASLYAQGRGDEAMRQLESQVGANPFDPVAMNNLAAMEAARNGWNAAATLLVRAHKLAPDNPIINNNLDALNAWLSHNTPAVDDSQTAFSKTDRLNELAQIPPEPPELWTSPKGEARTVAVAATSASASSVTRHRKAKKLPR